jgi:hypothetical protein
MKGLQKLKDITLYNLQLEMSTSGRKGFIYDVSQTPQGWEAEQVMKYLKTAGIAFIDSKKDGLPATHNQFQQIDQTLGASVEQYIRISQMIDAEMDAITGINYARQGQSTGANQGLGVTQTALMQSSMSTKAVDDLFLMLDEMVLNHLAGLVKLSFAGNERFAPIIGDLGVDFLDDIVDLELDDFGVFIEEIPPIIDDINSFRQIVTAAMSSGSIPFADAARLLIEKDITVGIDRLERAMQEREQKMMEQQMMMMQQEQAKAQQSEQARMAAEANKLAAEANLKLQLEEVKGGYKIQDTTIKGRQALDELALEGKIDSGQSKQDYIEELNLQNAKIKAELERLKANDSARKETSVKK